MSRALVVTQAHVLQWAEVPDPAPGPEEIIVRVRYTGLCGTDLHIVEGSHPRARFPIALGHEIVGVPESGSYAGRLVLVDPLLPCQTCAACCAGASNACAELRLIGIDRDGGLAGRIAVARDRIHPLPDGVSAELAPLAEPLGVAVHAVRRAPSLIGRLTVVVGGGPVGLLLAHVARRSGAKVLLAESAPWRRGLAGRLGYDLLDANDPVGDLKARNRGQLADAVFDAAGVPRVASLICGLAAARGWVGIVGAYGAPTAIDLQAVMFKELRIHGSRTYLPPDLDTALDVMLSDQDELRPLLSGVIEPDAVQTAIEALRAGESMKYVVEYPE
jgi:2-desacetyl-2-hydroxyethyl bacteriochlorophyllide A dehydrogenase